MMHRLALAPRLNITNDERVSSEGYLIQVHSKFTGTVESTARF